MIVYYIFLLSQGTLRYYFVIVIVILIQAKKQKSDKDIQELDNVLKGKEFSRMEKTLMCYIFHQKQINKDLYKFRFGMSNISHLIG